MGRYNIDGVEIELVTIAKIAKGLGISDRILKRWRQEGIIPKTPFIIPVTIPLQGDCKKRLYAEEHFDLLSEWLRIINFRPNMRLSKSDIHLLQRLWNETNDKILKKIQDLKTAKECLIPIN